MASLEVPRSRAPRDLGEDRAPVEAIDRSESCPRLARAQEHRPPNGLRIGVVGRVELAAIFDELHQAVPDAMLPGTHVDGRESDFQLFARAADVLGRRRYERRRELARPPPCGGVQRYEVQLARAAARVHEISGKHCAPAAGRSCTFPSSPP